MLVHELSYLYSAESQMMEVIPAIAKAAIESEMKNLMEEYLYKTTHHKHRLEKIGSALQVDINGANCKVTRSLIDEIDEIVIKIPTISKQTLPWCRLHCACRNMKLHAINVLCIWPCN